MVALMRNLVGRNGNSDENVHQVEDAAIRRGH